MCIIFEHFAILKLTKSIYILTANLSIFKQKSNWYVYLKYT
jgi:hypothetical protein